MTTLSDNTEATATRDEETVNADAKDSAETMSPDIEPTTEDDTTQEESEAVAEAESDDEPDEEPGDELAAEDDTSLEDESDEPPETKRERRPIAWSGLLAFGVLPGFALLLALTAGYFKWVDQSADGLALTRTESVRVASEDAVALLSYKPDSADKDLGAARERLTGDFKDAYTTLTREVVIPGAKEKHISTVAKVNAAASVSATANHAVVLLFVNQTVTIGEGASTDTQPVIRVTLDKVNGRWLVSRFDPV
jgi:Mce-associated membrane protein